jgi:hypothetical protein
MNDLVMEFLQTPKDNNNMTRKREDKNRGNINYSPSAVAAESKDRKLNTSDKDKSSKKPKQQHGERLGRLNGQHVSGHAENKSFQDKTIQWGLCMVIGVGTNQATVFFCFLAHSNIITWVCCYMPLEIYCIDSKTH